MSQLVDFHDVTFPRDIALNASGGPHRNTEIVVMGSGHEQRNQRWSQSLRRFDAGYGVKGLNELHKVIAFFEARRGPMFGFRFRDPMDWKSCLPLSQVSADDQLLGVGNGQQTLFPMTKAYGQDAQPYLREITKPVSGSVMVSVDGSVQTETVDYSVEYNRGEISFNSAPETGKQITCGFEFDTPVRFEADQLTINLAAFSAGEVPSIPLVEIRR